MKIATDILRKKRDGKALDAEELAFMVEGFSRGEIPDYQTSAWLMATFLQGMTVEETVNLTRLMKNSGESLEWRGLSPEFKNAFFADKHSTGGVGDKVSLVLAPLAALLDLKVPMMSGRGLGHTGGTVDKLESIPGFSMYLDKPRLIQGLCEVGTIMMAQSPSLCPADRKLYALRDVTSTIESIPLITASIVSKKWAAGVESIVYDVKCGRGAFMKSVKDARGLAESLVRTSKGAGMKALACITRMDEPLGPRIGNALEVEECWWILAQDYPSKELRAIATPLERLCCELSAEMAVLAGSRSNFAQALEECFENLRNGRALKKFEELLQFQGAEDNWREQLPRISPSAVLLAPRAGYLASIDSLNFGRAGIHLKVGRQKAEDAVDPATGFEIQVSVGDRLEKGQPLVKIFARNDVEKDLKEEILAAFSITDEKVSPAEPLTLERIRP